MVHRRRARRRACARTTSRCATSSRARLVELYEAVRRAVPARRRGRLRRAAAAHLRAAARQRAAARALPAPLPPHPGRRVPGHQPAAVRVAARCSPGRAQRGVRRRRRRPVHLRVPRRASRQHAATSSASSASEQPSIKLEQNYRSHGNILDAANALIAHNRDAARQEPAHRRRARASRCACYEAPSDFDEAQWIVDEVQGAVSATAWRAARSRVLYRSNAQSRVLEHALFNAALPYRVYGGLRFFERAEVKHALAYLRLHRRTRTTTRAFLRVVNFPRAASARARIEQLQDAARERGTTPVADGVRRRAGRQGRRRASPVSCADRGDARRNARAGRCREIDRARTSHASGSHASTTKRKARTASRTSRSRGCDEPSARGISSNAADAAASRERAAQDIAASNGVRSDHRESDAQRRSSRTPRSRPASTRRRPGRTRCS